MALSFSCDHPECDNDNLKRSEIVQVSVQVIDPEEGTKQDKKEYCLGHGDSQTAELHALGFKVE